MVWLPVPAKLISDKQAISIWYSCTVPLAMAQLPMSERALLSQRAFRILRDLIRILSTGYCEGAEYVTSRAHCTIDYGTTRSQDQWVSWVFGARDVLTVTWLFLFDGALMDFAQPSASSSLLVHSWRWISWSWFAVQFIDPCSPADAIDFFYIRWTI